MIEAMAKATGKCAGAAKHRAAQNKYVAKNRDKQRRMVQAHYRKNKSAIIAKKKRTQKAKGGKTGGKTGRPREC